MKLGGFVEHALRSSRKIQNILYDFFSGRNGQKTAPKCRFLGSFQKVSHPLLFVFKPQGFARLLERLQLEKVT
jgi:hypothetical protein